MKIDKENGGEEYPIQYQQSMDIDWFFCYNGLFFHVASNGILLPKIKNCKSPFFVNQVENQKVQNRLARLMSNDEYIPFEIDVRHNPLNLNYSSFKEFARMGFVSLDTIGKKELHVIARPKEYKYMELDKHLDIPIKQLDVKVARLQIIDIDGSPLILE